MRAQSGRTVGPIRRCLNGAKPKSGGSGGGKKHQCQKPSLKRTGKDRFPLGKYHRPWSGDASVELDAVVVSSTPA